MSADVLLVTCAPLPDGEVGGDLLVEDLAARGLDAALGGLGRPGRRLAAARVVAVRSTWDYETRREEFLAWARERRAGPAQRRRRVRLEHRQGLPPRPRRGRAARRTQRAGGDRGRGGRRGRAAFGVAVCKPDRRGRRPRAGGPRRAGRAGDGCRPVAGPAAGRVGPHRGRDLGVRPRRAGRWRRCARSPAPDEVRVHEGYGGRSVRRAAGGGARRAGGPDRAGRGASCSARGWPTPGWT